jgi:hypothetical protein
MAFHPDGMNLVPIDVFLLAVRLKKTPPAIGVVKQTRLGFELAPDFTNVFMNVNRTLLRSKDNEQRVGHIWIN